MAIIIYFLRLSVFLEIGKFRDLVGASKSGKKDHVYFIDGYNDKEINLLDHLTTTIRCSYCAIRTSKQWLSSRIDFSPPKIIWHTTNYDSLFFEGLEIEIKTLSKAYFYWYQKAYSILHFDLFLDESFKLDKKFIQKFKDNWSNSDNGYCFLEPIEASYSYKYVLSKILASKGYWNESSKKFEVSQLKKWMSKASTFVDYLICLVHLSSGQPSRVTELCLYRLRNSRFSNRSVFLFDGTIALLQTYHKSLSMTTINKAISRYLPEDLSVLLINYLIFIRPFEM
jgi:hypothetical protein